MLCFIGSTRIAAFVLFSATLGIGALFFLQTSSLTHQVAIVIAFGLPLILCGYVFRINMRIDSLRLQKG